MDADVEVEFDVAGSDAVCLRIGEAMDPVIALAVGHRNKMLEAGFNDHDAAAAALIVHDAAIGQMFPAGG